MRLFVALELPPEVKEAAATVTQQLRPWGADIKWVAPQNMHLTLRFLGEVAPEALAGIKTALSRALAGRQALDLAVRGCGAFPSPRRPQVIWLGLAGQVAELASLASAIQAGLEPLGFAPEARAFQAHLTLGRLRRGRGPARRPSPDQARDKAGGLARELAGLSGWEGPRFLAKRVALVQSTLTPKGPLYQPLLVEGLAA
ncbi:MAG: RNA 2',3'-cyclic phosphodiesterase [Pseudomonadota bacterium]